MTPFFQYIGQIQQPVCPNLPLYVVESKPEIFTALRYLSLRFLALWGPILKANKHPLVDLCLLWPGVLIVRVRHCNKISVLKSSLLQKKTSFITLISNDLGVTGLWNPWTLQVDTAFSLLCEALSLLSMEHLHSPAEIASCLLWYMTRECFQFLYIPLCILSA